MNVDTQFPQAPVATLPNRPTQAPPDRVSARPVDRPHRDEPANNQTRRDLNQAEAQKEAQRPAEQGRTIRQESELSADERRELEKLKARDREVRAHEAAHKAAAGSLARGGAQFEFETGPDGRRYAVGGEVKIDTSKVPGDPEATIRKAQTIRRAANAPAQPSEQDRRVATEAANMEAEARREVAEQQLEQQEAQPASSSRPQTVLNVNQTQPAPVGSLLDVIV